MIDVLFVSAGIFHPSLLARYEARRALAGMPGVRLHAATSLAALTTLDRRAYQALVLYYHHKHVTPAALDALKSWLADGCGILALHSATASFKDTPAYGAVLGGRFAGHAPVERFTVTACPGADEVFGKIPAFTLRDELYHHEMQPDCVVRFAGRGRDGEVPFVWTRTAGRGRVCYFGAGHVSSAFRHRTARQILQRGLAWVSRA